MREKEGIAVGCLCVELIGYRVHKLHSQLRTNPINLRPTKTWNPSRGFFLTPFFFLALALIVMIESTVNRKNCPSNSKRSRS